MSDKRCEKIFNDERGLSSHLDKSPECTKILTKMLYCQPIINNIKTSKIYIPN